MDKEYRQKVRSLSYNLSDASNPELRARVLQGEVNPDRLVQMTPNELASKVTLPSFLHDTVWGLSLQGTTARKDPTRAGTCPLPATQKIHGNWATH